jgi:hypothetical protein
MLAGVLAGKQAASGLALLIIAGAQAQGAAPSHCSATERVIFSCSTGAKLVSVCAAGELSAGAGSLSYRFGPAGQPEMTYPPPGSWHDATRSGTWAFSGGGGAWLAFHREAFRYIVYTAVGRGWGEKSGIAVEQNGKLLTNLPCRGEPVSELGPDFFSRAGIPDDPAPFDLP